MSKAWTSRDFCEFIALAEAARQASAHAVFWNEIAQARRGQHGHTALNEIGITSQSYPGDLLASPANIRTKEGLGFRVFTPFWRRGTDPG
jgi:deoxyribodipyrimidine photo-lyase